MISDGYEGIFPGQQETLDFESARQARDVGIMTAAIHAEQVEPGWNETAFVHLMKFVRYIGREKFTGEQVRSFATAQSCPQPPHLRAWGGVILLAARRGLIRKVGTVQVKNPRAHMANAALWEAA